MKMLKVLLSVFLVAVTISANASQSTRFVLLHCHCYQRATELFDAVEQQYGDYFPATNRVVFYETGDGTPVYTDIEKTQKGMATPKTTMIYRCYNNYQSCLLTWEDQDFYYMWNGNWYFFDSIANSLKYFSGE